MKKLMEIHTNWVINLDMLNNYLKKFHPELDPLSFDKFEIGEDNAIL